MQKISRIYLGNCGYRTAWYDGIILDLLDPGTGLPTDTVVNLENGGGKTTLLSLILSCFETSQDRFLKHIQTKSNHFAEYFANNGLPAVILVEWLMPSRTPSGDPYRLVVGQAVSIQGSHDTNPPTRIFFSFEKRASLQLKDVPAPRLTAAPAASMADMRQWLHAQQRQHTDNLFFTETQADWHRHLKDERHIDLDMLRNQVNFSAQEGGFDTGFLNFKNEEGFLTKFFNLTLDEQRAASLRENVGVTCDKLRRRPHYKRALDELNRFHEALQNFDNSARALGHHKALEAAIAVKGAYLVNALFDRARAHLAAQETEQQYAQTQMSIARTESARALEYTARQLSLVDLQWTRKVACAKQASEQAQAEYQEATDRLTFARAAHIQDAIDAASARLAELENDARAAAKGLLPFRQTAERNGSLLRLAIKRHADALQGRLDELSAARTERAARRTQLEQEARDATSLRDQATAEQARLHAQEQLYGEELARLVGNGLDAGEDPRDAVARWVQAATRESTSAENLERQRQQLLHRAEQLRQEKLTATQQRMQLDAQIKERNTFIGQGRAQQERLAQCPVILQAAQAETVELESPALPSFIAQLRDQAAADVSRSDVLLADLESKADAIRERGVAGADPDVDLVVQLLREAGVRSARPFKDYIAQALANADQARTLVMSDPARFLGVMVAEAEMDKVKSINWVERKPFLPVLVSMAELDPTPGRANVVSIAPFTDASYNIEAAATLAKTLNQSIERELERRKSHATRHAEAKEAHEQLVTFVSAYGNGKLAQASEQVAGLSAELEAVEMQIALAEEQVESAVAQAEACLDQARQHTERAQAARHFVEELERFISSLYAKRAERQLRMQELDVILEGANSRRILATEAMCRLDVETQQDSENRYRLSLDLQNLGKEHSAVSLFDETMPVSDGGASSDLESLRALYKMAEDTFKTNERERLGVLHTHIESQRVFKAGKTDEFQQHYSSVTREQMAPFVHATNAALVKQLEDGQLQSSAAKGAAQTHLQALEKEARTWRTNNVARPATPDMEALHDNALASAIAQAEADAAAATDRKQQAVTQAQQAERRSQELGNLAHDDEVHARSICTVMELPERPDLETMVLEAQHFGMDPVDPVVLDTQARTQVDGLVREFGEQRKIALTAGRTAQTAFQKLQLAASRRELQDVEPALSAQMQANDFDAACLDSARLLAALTDRIGTTLSSLNDMQADFNACLEEILNLARTGITLLNSATSKKVPEDAPYVGGKAVLRMRANFSSISAEVRRQTVQYYLDHLIDTNVIPATGADLVAEVVIRMPNNRTLGLRVLKMVSDESEQYVAFDKISNSGGEGIVMAMFLYGVISQLRAETQAKSGKAGGGPLILDNPFAKATSPAMWKAQRLLARSMGLQLIFATAIQDFNALGEFESFIRLRKAGQHSKTGRRHLELMKQTFLPEGTPESAHV